MLAEHGAALDTVVELTVDTDEVVGRLLKRAAEQGRSDDTEDVIRRRLRDLRRADRAADRASTPQQGLLVQVDGLGSVEDVTARVLASSASDTGHRCSAARTGSRSRPPEPDRS